jgi:bacteriorhodopsin
MSTALTRFSIWGVADGARIVGVDGEIIAYAVLDLLAKPVFGFWLLTTHDKNASSSPSVEGFWAYGASNEGTLRVRITFLQKQHQIDAN